MHKSLKYIVFYLLPIAFCLIPILVFTQNKEFDKANFPDKQKELKKITEAIKKGDKLIDKGGKNYIPALAFYLKADSFNNMSSSLNYKIGKCYLNVSLQKYKSISYLEKAYKLNNRVSNDILLLLGDAYHLNYEFDKAITKYLAYKETIKASDYDRVIDKKIQECNTAKDFVKRPLDVLIENVGPVVNGKFPDYSPIINANETMMIFTSRRDKTTGGKIAGYDNKYYEDIYITYYKADSNKWSKPYNPPPPVNTYLHDATVGLNPKGDKLLLYKTNNQGDIFESSMDSTGKLTKPESLGKPINTSSHESVASYSPDGRTLYFCSNRDDDSFGGHDIFLSRKDKDGKWGPPMNLGKVINTPYDEESVFMQADGKTLFFSSNGHNTMGGFDIFKTVFEKGQWTVPVNLGYPINTPDDDVHFSITADGQHGYYSSAKIGGYGDLDIYRISFLGVDKTLKGSYEELFATTINLPKDLPSIGIVYDIQTKLPVCSAKVRISDKKTGILLDSVFSQCPSGEYHSALPKCKLYEINVMADGYTPYYENIPECNDVNKIIYIGKPSEAGYVYDAETKLPVCANVLIKNSATKQKADSLDTECETGKYLSAIDKCFEYDILVTSPGYIPYTESTKKCDPVNKIIYIKKSKGVAIFGNVYDADSKEPVCAKVTIKNNKTKQVADSVNTICETGKFKSEVPKCKQYYILVTSPGYIPYFETTEVCEDVNKIIYIKKEKILVTKGKIYDLSQQKSFVLPNILYDFDKFFLKPESKDSLNDLINTMAAYPNIVIELGSHTDTRGTDEYNQKLSYNRAKSVVDYLITMKIDPDRLVAKGYGEKVPRTLDKTMKFKICDKVFTFPKGTTMDEKYIESIPDVKCEREAAHQLNRRTEFKVLRDDYDPTTAPKSKAPVKIDVIIK